MSNLLTLNNAQVSRGGNLILDIDSLVIESGKSVAILGPNGAGKSTLVGLVTREVFPLHRDVPPVVFCENPRMTLAETKACVGVVSASSQNAIRRHISAIDIVIGGLFGSVGLPVRRQPTNVQRNQAYNVMSELGIEDLAPRDFLTLSTGQARRVLIARALVHDPSILVLDEPCAGLDPEGMYYVRKAIDKLASQNRSVFLVTHYLDDIMPSITDVILIKDGKIFESGTTDDIITSENMTRLFEVPISVSKERGWFSASFIYG